MPESEEDRVRRVYRTYMPTVRRWRGDNPGNQAIGREREAAVQHRLRRLGPLGRLRILDLGCGMGQDLAALKRGGAIPERCVGLDLLPERLAAARRQHPDVPLVCGDAARLGFRQGAFDLILVFTLFSSILEPGTRRAIAREMARALSPGGFILYYDLRYDSPANPNVRALSRREVRRLFPGFDDDLGTLTLLPPLARRLGSFTPILYRVLRILPPLRSHRFGLLRRRGGGDTAGQSGAGAPPAPHEAGRDHAGG